MHLGDFRCPRGFAGPDRPDRLIHDTNIRRGYSRRHARFELGGNHPRGAPLFALSLAFTDTEDCRQAGAAGGLNLGRYQGVGFAVIEPAFGMPQDNCRRTRIAKHLSRNIPGKRPRGQRMTVLAAYRDRAAFCRLSGLHNQSGRRTDKDIPPRRRLNQAPRERADFRQRGPQPVHLPIAGQQHPHICLIPWGLVPTWRKPCRVPDLSLSSAALRGHLVLPCCNSSVLPPNPGSLRSLSASLCWLSLCGGSPTSSAAERTPWLPTSAASRFPMPNMTSNCAARFARFPPRPRTNSSSPWSRQRPSGSTRTCSIR